MKNKLFMALILTCLAAGCAGHKFNNQIEATQYDVLAEESFMRYNTNRLNVVENASGDFISQALVACHQSKFVKGEGILEEKMHANKTNPFYWNALGTCYGLSEKTEKSIFYYELGLEATRAGNKDYNDSQKKLAETIISNNLGLIHLGFKRYNEAYDMFKKSSTAAPQYFTPAFNMAQLYIEFNENAKALEILKKLEAKNAQDIDVLYALSLVYYKQNDMEKSFHYISRIKADYLNRADIVGLYAYNLMKKNRLVEAKTILEKRLYANEYDQRNEMILDEVNQQIKTASDSPK